MYIEFSKVDKKSYEVHSFGIENVMFVSTFNDDVRVKVDGERDWREYRSGRDFDYMSIM